MEKYAVPDPRHKALKQHKKNWNKATKELISRLIAFKRALSGVGDKKYALPPSKIHDPLPAELINFLNTLTSNYEAVAEDALRVINEQNEFSKSRVSQAPKTASLKSEASNFITRFLAYLKSPFLSEENKKTRISLLKSLSKMEDLLKEFEEKVLSTGSSSAHAANKIFEEEVKPKFNLIYGFFDSLTTLEQNSISTPQNINTGDLDKLMKHLKSVIADMGYAESVPNIESPQFYSVFDSLVTKFNKETNIEEKKKTAIHIIETYNKALRAANFINKTTAKSFKELFELTKNKASAEISAVATNLVSRWLKKKWQEMPFGESSSIKLTIQEASESSRDIINELMNSLEYDLDIDQTKRALYQLHNNLELIRKNLSILTSFHEKSRPKDKK